MRGFDSRQPLFLCPKPVKRSRTLLLCQFCTAVCIKYEALNHTAKQKGDVNRLPSVLFISTLFFCLLLILRLFLATQIFSGIGFFLAFFPVVMLLKRLVVIDGVIRVEICIAGITVQFCVISLHGLLVLLVNVFVIQNALLSDSILVRRLF